MSLLSALDARAALPCCSAAHSSRGGGCGCWDATEIVEASEPDLDIFDTETMRDWLVTKGTLASTTLGSASESTSLFTGEFREERLGIFKIIGVMI